MLVILKQDVKGTGKAGDLVKVSDGYARNMLLPKGIAIEATDGNVKQLEKEKAEAAQKLAEDKAEAEKVAAKLKESKVVIETKVGEGGKVFGSITSKDIAEAVEQQLSIKVDKKKVELGSPIKEIGEFVVDIKLFTEVKGCLKVEVKGK